MKKRNFIVGLVVAVSCIIPTTVLTESKEARDSDLKKFLKKKKLKWMGRNSVKCGFNL